MSVSFTNFNLARIILHNVYAPTAEGRIEPKISSELNVLEANALGKLEERLTHVLGRGSHCIEMEVADFSDRSCFRDVCRILSTTDKQFIAVSAAFANRHTDAHTNRRWPGGTLVIIDGTVGATPKRCLIIIKAERQEGFLERISDSKVAMEYVENLLLTPQTKLYKVGVFVEVESECSEIAVESRLPGEFNTFVFDSNMTAKDERRAAQYFYSNFLGLRIPTRSEHQTRDFFDYTTAFIDESDLSTEAKVDLHNALYTYLKTDQSNIVEVSGFAQNYLSEEARDDYEAFMRTKGFPEGAVLKNISLLAGRLRTRKMNFSNSVKISAPADTFASDVRVIESALDSTTVLVKGRLLDQE